MLLGEITEAMEHYLEAIYELETEWGSASSTEIAKKRGVKTSSVTYMLRKLHKLGLISYRKYRNITLTPLGRKHAKKLERTHKVMKWFLTLIGVDEKIADTDACALEHRMHPQTTKRLTEFAEWVTEAPKDPKWLQHFYEFQKTGKRVEECFDSLD